MKVKLMKYIEDFGFTRIVAVTFFLVVACMVPALGLNTATLFSQAFTRMAMNGVLVLTMVPIMVCGAGMNFALPIGIICGLIGGLISLNLRLTGLAGFAAAIICSIPFSLVFGYLYGQLMNRVKGSEMIIATYVGFTMISIMCIVWLFVPLNNLVLRIRWAAGSGRMLRWQNTGRISWMDSCRSIWGTWSFLREPSCFFLPCAF